MEQAAEAIAEEPGKSAAKVATAYIIWIVRIALPIIFFWVWYRTQPEKDSWYSRPHEISLSREELMSGRKSVGVVAAPKEMANIRVSREGELPQSNERARTATRAGAKRDARPKNVEEPAPAGAGAPVSSEHGGRKPEDDRKGERRAELKGGGDSPALLAGEERAEVEKLLSYVTFSHKDRPTRVFLPTDGQPPPPPKKNALTPAPPADQKALVRANADAQLVLRCVSSRKLDLRPSDVSKALYERLIHSSVRVTEATLAQMAESCANAGDLKGASDFLMKMEAAGHCPDSALLDKVMDLFSEEKDQQEQAASADSRGAGDLGETGGRTHPWSATKGAQQEGPPHLNALNFGAYSEDEGE